MEKHQVSSFILLHYLPDLLLYFHYLLQAVPRRFGLMVNFHNEICTAISISL